MASGLQSNQINPHTGFLLVWCGPHCFFSHPAMLAFHWLYKDKNKNQTTKRGWKEETDKHCKTLEGEVGTF